MSLFPEWSRLGGFRTLTEVRQYYRLPDEAWAIVTRVIGDPGDDIRFFGALPRSAVVGGATSAQYDDGTTLSPVAATQVGLMWRLSRMILACKAGVADTDFVDEDPWAPLPQSGANFPPVPPTGTAAPPSSGVKERVLKMASLIDQQDESELLPATNNELNQWTQNFINVMGALPERSEEPTGSQLAALAKRTLQQGNSPYCDFAVWVPFERRMSKTQKCRVYHPLAGGGYLVKDLPGPGSHLAWLASWRVFKTAAVMLRIATLASLQIYERTIERIHAQWPSAWGLLYEAEDRARAEQLDRWRRHFIAEEAAGRQLPLDWDRDNPWSCLFKTIAEDASYWAEFVHHPAAAWVASGQRGKPQVATEAQILNQIQGGKVSHDQDEGGSSRRAQANRDRKAAKKKSRSEEQEELQRFRKSAGAPAPKGKGKGKTKDQTGKAICFSWSSGTGPCGKLPPGSDCACEVKRVRKCRNCLSPSHRESECPGA